MAAVGSYDLFLQFAAELNLKSIGPRARSVGSSAFTTRTFYLAGPRAVRLTLLAGFAERCDDFFPEPLGVFKKRGSAGAGERAGRPRHPDGR